MLSVLFYDAEDWQAIGRLAPPEGRRAALYIDGVKTAAPLNAPGELGLMEHRWITVLGNGQHASICDGRPDNNIGPAGMRAFVRERRALEQDAIIYTPRAFAVEWIRALFDNGHGSLLAYPQLWWWIATLDGKPWTAKTLSEELIHFDADIPARRIWANQNEQLPELGPGALVDVSQLFLAFHP